jgi:hypothetical protein
MKSFNSPVFILISDLNYNGDDDKVMEIDRPTFYRMKRWNGRYLRERISLTKYLVKKDEIERQQFKKQYRKAIMEKYNVGEDYEQNRYFIEQVRPTLY